MDSFCSHLPSGNVCQFSLIWLRGYWAHELRGTWGFGALLKGISVMGTEGGRESQYLLGYMTFGL